MSQEPPFAVEIRQVTKRFGDVAAVDGVSLAIGRGELFSLLGPSGCGKTTLLRLIGGLEAPTAGSIHLDGAEVTATPPHRRPVNMVFQHYALFPHLTVAENVAFGLRYQRVPRSLRPAKVREALALVRLSGFEDRAPHQLSGGQRQRVALARALALEPRVLLLDEPLGALDQKLRKEVQVEIKHLQRTLGITFVFVTHDQEEALAMSDRIAVMSHGRVIQLGTPARIFERPESALVAEFMGAANFLTAEVLASGPAVLRMRLAHGLELSVPPPDAGAVFRPGEAVRCLVRPEKLALLPAAPADPARAVIPVTVEDRVYQGASTQWIVRGPGGERLVILEQNSRPLDGLPPLPAGAGAYASWDPSHTVIVRED